MEYSVTSSGSLALNVEPITQFLSGQLAIQTKRAYQNDLRLFLEYAGMDIKDLVRTNAGSIYNLAVDYRNSISKLDAKSGYVLNASTVARKISVLKVFFNYMVKLGCYTTNPVKDLKLPSVPTESTSNSLTISEVKAIFKQIDYNSLVGKRDMAILSLMFHCALRRSEVARLKMSSLKMIGEYTVIEFYGKRNKHRTIPLKPEVFEYLKRYIHASGRKIESDEEYIFLSHSNRNKNSKACITEQTIWNVVQKYASAAGIVKPISPHSFRHTAVTISLDNGCSYREVMNLTGHSDSRMVMRYDRGDKLKNNATWKIPSVVD